MHFDCILYYIILYYIILYYIILYYVSSNLLSAEVRILQGVKKFYGVDSVEVLEKYFHLSKDGKNGKNGKNGKKRVHQYMDDLSEIYSV